MRFLSASPDRGLTPEPAVVISRRPSHGKPASQGAVGYLLFSRGPRIVNRLEGDELDAEFADLSHQTMQVTTGNLGVSAADPGASALDHHRPLGASGSGTVYSRTDPAVPGALSQPSCLLPEPAPTLPAALLTLLTVKPPAATDIARSRVIAANGVRQASGRRSGGVARNPIREDSGGARAADDVTGPSLASVATDQGRQALCGALGLDFCGHVDQIPAAAVYGLPEVGPTRSKQAAVAPQRLDGWKWPSRSPGLIVAVSLTDSPATAVLNREPPQRG